jgi:hypothetical protein
MIAACTIAALSFSGSALKAPRTSGVQMVAKSKAIPFLDEPKGARRRICPARPRALGRA